MNNKKGFTLVELLGAIAILAIIIGIATTGAIAIGNKSKKKMYNTKVDLILNAAQMFALDNQTEGEVGVDVLTNKGYLKYDDKTKKEVSNPIDKTKLNTGAYKVKITKVNNRYVAKLDCTKTSNGYNTTNIDSTWNKNNSLNDEILKKYCS